jgi:Protein of unknown function (DUF992)
MSTHRFKTTLESLRGPTWRAPRLARSVEFGAALAASHAAPALSHAGVLICTTLSAKSAKAVARLSCQFDALKGPGADFRGWLRRKGSARSPAGRRVFTWSVLSKGAIDPEMLAGTYKGITGCTAHAARLRGGQGGNILLEPVTASSQVGPRPILSVLELRLTPLRA